MTIFDLVRAYADLGVHRSGTGSQGATAAWLADELASRGGDVRLEPVAFDRYTADWSVSIDGDEVDTLPLFYEATGAASTDDPHRWEAFSPAGAGPLGISGAVDDAELSPGDVVVAATQNLLGFLSVSNRAPRPGSGVHVLQVAGHHGGALADGAPVQARVDARIEPSSCTNVAAAFGDIASADRLTVVTTPISGWFRCAGERGTGIAVALEMTSRLATERPVLFLGATGHELGAFGAAAFHERWRTRADTVLHVGANVGCEWAAGAGLAAPDHSHMAARLAADPSAFDSVGAAFDRIGVRVDAPARDRSQWFGEAADWLDAPRLLSYLGQNPWFHTPGDLPDVSCTAARTEAVAEAFTEAALELVRR